MLLIPEDQQSLFYVAVWQHMHMCKIDTHSNLPWEVLYLMDILTTHCVCLKLYMCPGSNYHFVSQLYDISKWSIYIAFLFLLWFCGVNVSSGTMMKTSCVKDAVVNPLYFMISCRSFKWVRRQMVHSKDEWWGKRQIRGFKIHQYWNFFNTKLL